MPTATKQTRGSVNKTQLYEDGTEQKSKLNHASVVILVKVRLLMRVMKYSFESIIESMMSRVVPSASTFDNSVATDVASH